MPRKGLPDQVGKTSRSIEFLQWPREREIHVQNDNLHQGQGKIHIIFELVAKEVLAVTTTANENNRMMTIQNASQKNS
jgi:hypothetical protein